MQNPGWLNLMSLCLGLAALVLPVAGGLILARQGRRWHGCIGASLAACAVSLYCQIAYTRYLVDIQDFSALMDTQTAVQRCAKALLLAVLLVNGITTAILETQPGMQNTRTLPQSEEQQNNH